MGYSDIGCFGAQIETPNIDRLAENGVTFTRFYNNARCSPSRAAILTGLNPHLAGMGANAGGKRSVAGYRGDLNEHCVTLAEVLKPAGYKSYATGKWHLTGDLAGKHQRNWPLQRGFDRFYGMMQGADSYFDTKNMVVDNEFMPKLAPDFYLTDAIADSTAQIIKDHFSTSGDSPFFFYVAFSAPHWPLHAKAEDVKKYRGTFDEGWTVLRERKLERMQALGLLDASWNLADQNALPPWDSVENKDWEVSKMEAYAALVEQDGSGNRPGG